MNFQKTIASASLAIATSVCFISASFADKQADTQTDQQPDNTRLNQRDQSVTEVSADDQGAAKSDVELTRKIRQRVISQKTFSTYAKNIKIITLQGQVTLKGPVKSAEEKTQIEDLAKKVAGNSKVQSQIEIKQ